MCIYYGGEKIYILGGAEERICLAYILLEDVNTRFTIASFTGHYKGFHCLQYELMHGRPLSPVMMQVATMPLGLVSTQAC